MPAETQEITKLVELLPWRKPVVQRLVISIDTQSGGASVDDGDGFEFLVGDFQV